MDGVINEDGDGGPSPPLEETLRCVFSAVPWGRGPTAPRESCMMPAGTTLAAPHVLSPPQKNTITADTETLALAAY